MDKNVKYITSLSRVEYVQLLIALSTRIDYLMNMIAGLPSDGERKISTITIKVEKA